MDIALSYILVPVRDLDVMRAWYRDVLELPMGTSHESAAEFVIGEVTLAFYQSPDAVAAGETEGLYIAFDVEDVPAQVTLLKSRGVVFKTDVERRGPRLVADFYDPEGNLLGIAQAVAG